MEKTEDDMGMRFLIAVIFLAIGFFIGVGVFMLYDFYEEEPIEVEEPQSLLNSFFDSWGQNIDNNDEILFDYWVENYGDKEATNVGVTCKVWDSNYNLLYQTEENIGNIASYSSNFEEVVRKNVPFAMTNIATCYVSSCDGNCKILWKDMKDYEEIYGE